MSGGYTEYASKEFVRQAKEEVTSQIPKNISDLNKDVQTSWNELSDKPFYVGEMTTVRKTVFTGEIHGDMYEVHYDYDENGEICDDWREYSDYSNFSTIPFENWVGLTTFVTFNGVEYQCETTIERIREEIDEMDYYDYVVHTILSNDGGLKIEYKYDENYMSGDIYSIYVNGEKQPIDNTRYTIKVDVEETITPVKTINPIFLPDGYPKIIIDENKDYYQSPIVPISSFERAISYRFQYLLDEGYTVEEAIEEWGQQGYFYHFSTDLPLNSPCVTFRMFKEDGTYDDYITKANSGTYYEWSDEDDCSYEYDTVFINDTDISYSYSEEYGINVGDGNWFGLAEYGFGGNTYKKWIAISRDMANKYVSVQVLDSPDDFKPLDIKLLSDEVALKKDIDQVYDNIYSSNYLTYVSYSDLPAGYASREEEEIYNLDLDSKVEYVGDACNGYDDMSEQIFYLITNKLFKLEPHVEYSVIINTGANSIDMIAQTDENGNFVGTDRYGDPYFYIKHGSLSKTIYYWDDETGQGETREEVISNDCWYIQIDRSVNTITVSSIYINQAWRPKDYKTFDPNFIPKLSHSHMPDGYAQEIVTKKTEIVYNNAELNPNYVDEYGGCYKYILTGLDRSKLMPGHECQIDLYPYPASAGEDEDSDFYFPRYSTIGDIIGDEPSEEYEWDDEDNYIPTGKYSWYTGAFIDLASDEAALYSWYSGLTSIEITIDDVEERTVTTISDELIPDTVARVSDVEEKIQTAVEGHVVSWNDLTDKPFHNSEVITKYNRTTVYESTVEKDEPSVIYDNSRQLHELVNKTICITLNNKEYIGRVYETLDDNLDVLRIFEAEGLKWYTPTPGWNAELTGSAIEELEIRTPYSFKVETVEEVTEFIEKKFLDEEFIPDTIARVSDIERVEKKIKGITYETLPDKPFDVNTYISDEREFLGEFSLHDGGTGIGHPNSAEEEEFHSIFTTQPEGTLFYITAFGGEYSGPLIIDESYGTSYVIRDTEKNFTFSHYSGHCVYMTLNGTELFDSDFNGTTCKIEKAVEVRLIDDKHISENIARKSDLIKVSGAKAGQIIEITEVDENGVPIAWRAVDHSIGYPVVNMTDTEDITLLPNKFFIWNDPITSLSVKFNSAYETDGITNEYCFQFTCGETATELTIEGDIKWATPLTILPNRTYQISILNGIGVIASVS